MILCCSRNVSRGYQIYNVVLIKSCCRYRPKLTAYLRLYRYIACPTRMGRWEVPMSTILRNWIVDWFEMKFWALNWVVNWIDMKHWLLNWIVNRVSFHEHVEGLSLNWIQTLCLNLKWVITPKKAESLHIGAISLLKIIHNHGYVRFRRFVPTLLKEW